MPVSKSQETKWRKEIRARLADWIANEMVPRLTQGLERQSLPASVRAENDKVLIDCVPLTAGTGYVAQAVMLESGARSKGEPSVPRLIHGDAAAWLPMLVLPAAMPQVMRAERSFWEKATSIPVFWAQAAFRGGKRIARHGYDAARLDSAGFVDAASADTALGKAVADHKRLFFAEKSPHGELID